MLATSASKRASAASRCACAVWIACCACIVALSACACASRCTPCAISTPMRASNNASAAPNCCAPAGNAALIVASTSSIVIAMICLLNQSKCCHGGHDASHLLIGQCTGIHSQAGDGAYVVGGCAVTCTASAANTEFLGELQVRHHAGAYVRPVVEAARPGKSHDAAVRARQCPYGRGSDAVQLACCGIPKRSQIRAVVALKIAHECVRAVGVVGVGKPRHHRAVGRQ